MAEALSIFSRLQHPYCFGRPSSPLSLQHVYTSSFYCFVFPRTELYGGRSSGNVDSSVDLSLVSRCFPVITCLLAVNRSVVFCGELLTPMFAAEGDVVVPFASALSFSFLSTSSFFYSTMFHGFSQYSKYKYYCIYFPPWSVPCIWWTYCSILGSTAFFTPFILKSTVIYEVFPAIHYCFYFQYSYFEFAVLNSTGTCWRNWVISIPDTCGTG